MSLNLNSVYYLRSKQFFIYEQMLQCSNLFYRSDRPINVNKFYHIIFSLLVRREQVEYFRHQFSQSFIFNFEVTSQENFMEQMGGEERARRKEGEVR